MMWGDPYQRQGWGDWLIGWIFGLLLLAFAAEVLANQLAPVLPWIAFAFVVFVSAAIWVRRRERW